MPQATDHIQPTAQETGAQPQRLIGQRHGDGLRRADAQRHEHHLIGAFAHAEAVNGGQERGQRDERAGEQEGAERQKDAQRLADEPVHNHVGEGKG